MTTLAIYARLSQQGEDEESIRRQIELGQAYAQAHDLTPRLFVEDPGHRSGTSERSRPHWRELKECIKRGELQVIWVADMARAARNTRAFLEFADLCNEHRVQLISDKEHFDLNTPDGRFMLTLNAAFNERFASDIGERQKRAIARVKARGGTWGATPLGLKRDRDKKYCIDPEATYDKGHYLDTVAEFYSRYIGPERVGCKALARDLMRDGYRWRNRKGAPGEIKHEYLQHLLETVESFRLVLPGDLLDTVAQRYAERAHHRENGRPVRGPKPVLWRLVWCLDCDRRLQIEHKLDTLYYRHFNTECDGQAGYRADALEPQLYEIMRHRVELSPEQKERARQRQERPKKKPIDATKLQAQLKRAKDLYVLEEIDLDEYQARSKELRARLSQIEKDEKAQPPAKRIPLEEQEWALAHITEMLEKAATVDTGAVNNLLRTIFERIWVRGGRIVRLEAKPAYRGWFPSRV